MELLKINMTRSQFWFRKMRTNMIIPIFCKNGKMELTTIFSLVQKGDVDELTTFITDSEANGVRSIHFFFPNDPENGPQMSVHLAISVAGFSQAFSAFQKA